MKASSGFLGLFWSSNLTKRQISERQPVLIISSIILPTLSHLLSLCCKCQCRNNYARVYNAQIKPNNAALTPLQSPKEPQPGKKNGKGIFCARYELQQGLFGVYLFLKDKRFWVHRICWDTLGRFREISFQPGHISELSLRQWKSSFSWR